ncbi:GNAT family N-acetyltransferase [Agrobacterium sp. SHOUNA12C]|uniref:Vicibactin acetylase protein n=2 Tax=Rhizobium rhizogenes TaxID=359 RepID=B9JI10_RHIR8|nr:GNAT family N-acetyltransferase [Rhizobium rhizogenes]ACM29552.1 vicibactin acetylase protein [Rhizobium rhizogenes K84]KAA6487679.1 GNAT family N-acetyltransferase [Agrobacterium sp. ICMP 7243]MCJ9720598.1 GNAT family N-acetyltransferase [Agrobacterium sp. BETTINA12B]MCJ9758569.1 GNAT family N-acetyltransferase [Agrobacterium sp. SHOUNA12C]OCI96248.1 acetylase [Agrobacterium sp. 13-626]OCJ22935.1 acetylase [Agrobacterium sp. B133/95]
MYDAGVSGSGFSPSDERSQIQDAIEITSDKGNICREIMSELTEWFSEPDVIETCAEAIESLPMFGCVDNNRIAGFVAMRSHPPDAMEILVIATRRAYHRSGVGKRLLAAAEDCARSAGCKILTVKTLAPRGKDEPQYDATRAFYDRNGFIRAEIFPTLWHEDHPCLFFVKPLEAIS